MLTRAALLVSLGALGALAGCAVYDAPPEATVVGLDMGFLPDPTAPLVLSFTKAPVPGTLKLEVADYVVDAEGRLGDEPGNTVGMPLDVLFAHDPAGTDTGGAAALSGATLTITPAAPFPIGAPLVALIEPGLSDGAGGVTTARRRLVFAYGESLDCDAPVHVFHSGTFFFLAVLSKPITVQVALYGVISLDPTTGKYQGQFTRAKRNPDGTRCNPPCDATTVCQTLPGPAACVAPGTPAGSVEEFPDYVPNADPPTGVTFAAPGCTSDHAMMTGGFITTPEDVAVQSPPVTLSKAQLLGPFAADFSGILRGSGIVSVADLVLGTTSAGPGSGSLSARELTGMDVPPMLPQPSPSP